MKKYFLFFLLVAVCNLGFAQTKLLTIEDALVRNRVALATENLKQLQFIYGTEDYVYLKKINDKDVWVKGSFKTDEQNFLSLSELNQKLRAANLDTLTVMPAIQFNQGSE